MSDPNRASRRDERAGQNERAGRDLAVESNAKATETVARDAKQAAGDVEPQAASTRRVGRFDVSSVLGSGAFGDVYLATDPQLQREVALKVPRKGSFRQGEEAERFLREARSAAALQHPNICPVHEVFEEDDHFVIVMGYIRGRRLDQYFEPGRPLPEAQAARVVARLAKALQYAHDKGIIHRDLKPANIIVDADRKEPVIMDFGLARREDSGDAALTRSGDILGSPAYMSPEQARGRVSEIGPHSDVYSLGVILYELLCGERPFGGSVAQVIGCIIHVETPPPSTRHAGIDPALEAICLKAMSKDKSDRFGSMREFASALTAWGKQQRGQSGDASGASQAGDLDEPRVNTPGSASGVASSASKEGVAAGVSISPFETVPSADVSAITATVAREEAGIGKRPANASVGWAPGPSSPSDASVSSDPLVTRRAGGPSYVFARRAVLSVGAALLLLGAIIFSIRTPEGTVQFTLSDPTIDANIQVDGSTIAVTANGQHYSLKVGDHELQVTAPGFETVTKNFTIQKGHNPALEIALIPDTPPSAASPTTAPEMTGQPRASAELPVAVSLFNGLNLTGWQQDSGSQSWRVQDGILSTAAGFGALATEAQYSDFDLQLEFRVQPGANSGVFLRMNSPVVDRGSSCVEVQILDDTSPEYQKAPYKSGAVYGLVSAAPPAAVRPNQWYQMGIRLVGSTLRVEVSGVVTADLDLTHYAAKVATLKLYDTQGGFIGLQRYDTGVEFRNITVRDLTPPAQLQSSTTGAAAESALAALAARVAPLKGKPAADPGVAALRKELNDFRLKQYGTPHAIEAAELMAELRWPVDEFRRADIDPYELMVAGFGNPDAVPAEVVAIVGDSRWKHWSYVESLEFSRDGRWLASAGQEVPGGVAIVWNVETGQARHIFEEHPTRVREARFSPDGKYLATCCSDPAVADAATLGVYVWEIESGQLVKHLRMPASAPVRRVAWSSDGALLATANYLADGQSVGTAIWNAADWSLRHTLPSTTHCYSVDFHPGQNILATAGMDSTVTLWDAVSGTPLPDREPMKHTAAINVVRFSHDGQSLASAGTDKVVRIWETASGKLRQTLSGHTEPVYGLDFSPDDRELASASPDGSIRVWTALGSDKPTSRVVVEAHSSNDIHAVAFSPDGQFLASGGTPKAVRFWSRPDYKPVVRGNAPGDGMTMAALSLDGSTLAMLGRAHTISTWSIDDRKLLAQPHGYSTLGVRGVAMTPDAQTAVHPRSWESAGIRYYDSRTGRQSRTALRVHAIEAAVSPDGRLLGIGTRYPNRIQIRNIETGQQLAAFDHPKDEVGWVLNFTPDSRTLISNYWGSGRLLLWDVATGESRGEMSAHQGEVTNIDFRADGSLAVSCSSNRGPELKVWDLSKKAAVAELITPELRASCTTCNNARISPDGRLIAAQVAPGRIQFWTLPGLQPCGTVQAMPENTESIGRMFFSADSRHLISVQWNGTFQVVRIPVPILTTQKGSST